MPRRRARSSPKAFAFEATTTTTSPGTAPASICSSRFSSPVPAPESRTAIRGRAAPKALLLAQLVEDRARRGAPVQRVEVDPRRPAPDELAALERRPLDADRPRELVVVLDRREARGELVGDPRAGHRGHAPDPGDAHDRHDAGHDRHADPRRAGALDEREIVGVVEEELRDQELDARLDLAHEVAQVRLGALGERMCLGIAGAAEAEAPARAYEGRELVGVVEGAGRRRVARRAVAAEREDVLDAA